MFSNALYISGNIDGVDFERKIGRKAGMLVLGPLQLQLQSSHRWLHRDFIRMILLQSTIDGGRYQGLTDFLLKVQEEEESLLLFVYSLVTPPGSMIGSNSVFPQMSLIKLNR